MQTVKQCGMGAGIWTPVYLESNPRYGIGVWLSGREFASYESPKFHLWDPFSQIMGLQLLGCMTLRKTAPPSPRLSFFICKGPSRQ